MRESVRLRYGCINFISDCVGVTREIASTAVPAFIAMQDELVRQVQAKLYEALQTIVEGVLSVPAIYRRWTTDAWKQFSSGEMFCFVIGLVCIGLFVEEYLKKNYMPGYEIGLAYLWQFVGACFGFLLVVAAYLASYERIDDEIDVEFENLRQELADWREENIYTTWIETGLLPESAKYMDVDDIRELRLPRPKPVILFREFREFGTVFDQEMQHVH